MRIDTLSTALSGFHSASKKIGVSAHNTANLLTEDFHPQRAAQLERSEGGSEVRVHTSEEPREVDLAGEIVGQMVAKVQADASLNVVKPELELIGGLIDLKA